MNTGTERLYQMRLTGASALISGKHAKRWLMFVLFVLHIVVVCQAASASPPRPHIFYSDLESGPNSGGEKNAGAYVTIYGIHFGSSRGASTVTVGGRAVASYPIWTESKITFQLGALVATGPIVVATPAGSSNTDVLFTVRKNGTCGVSRNQDCLYFVTERGRDSNSGSFSSPWGTVPYAVEHSPVGGIIYTSVGQLTDDGQTWKAAITLRNFWCGASPDGYPRALIAYPGATVTIGTATGPYAEVGIRGTDISAGEGACTGYWTFAGLQLRGIVAVLLNGASHTNPSSHWRFVGNDLSCPDGDGATGCWETSFASHIRAYGNHVHDTGRIGPPTASAMYHGVYFSTDSNQIDFGWNTIAHVHGCRGLQVYSTRLDPQSGYNSYDIAIHDNLIHDTQCDGMVINNIDPSKGAVRIYNNIIYNAGTGPNNPEHTGNWSCIYVPGETNNGSPGRGTVEVYNNTLYNCGSFSDPPYGHSTSAVTNAGINPEIRVEVRNNIIYQQKGVPYLLCAPAFFCRGIYGSNNLFFGSGAAPFLSGLSNSINKDPLFANLARGDFHLTAASPARGSGADTGLSTDADGDERNSSSPYDLGALQFEAP
jgi:IPT/TIG domain